MSHHRYILCSLNELGLSYYYPTSIPMDPCLFATLSTHMSSPLLTGFAIIYYQCGMDKLIHVLNTRPDVAFATGVCTRFTSTPHEALLHAMLQIWSYLRGTPNLALHYQRGGECTPIGFSNSDYFGDKDEHCSTLGIIITYGYSSNLMEEQVT